MKKNILILLSLLLGVSFNSIAGTGSANDQLYFSLVIIGTLLIILVLLSGVDYLRKNGRTMINKTTSFLRGKIGLLRQYLNKVNSDYYGLSNFKPKNSQVTE